LAAVAVLVLAFWIALGSSPKIESLVARVQAGRLTGVSERIVRAAAWMDAAPIPREVFTSGFSALQDAGEAATELTADELDAAFLDLQRKQLCRAIPRGWVFHEQVRREYRTANAAGQDWWRRALLMLIESAPDDEESPESVERWRLLLPHLIALFESAPKSALTEPPMQSLLSALSRGLLASRIEPGRRPALSPDSQEPDELHKRISVFVEEANKSLEEGVKLIEAKYGRFSNEMVTAHRLLAELSWRTRALKKEQDSWVRASRALEKQEQRDATEIAFCDVRLGISRAIASDHDGAEEAFVEALKVLSEQLGPTHPQIGRLQRKIARVYADLGQFDQAWAHHQQALDVLMKSYPAPTPEIADLLEEQAQFLIDYRDFAKGIGLLKRGIEVRQKIEYPTSPELARAYGTLADAQALQGEMGEAEQSARTQLGLLEKNTGRRPALFATLRSIS
jgi:tetratricopeptide (TPR) repeat protein